MFPGPPKRTFYFSNKYFSGFFRRGFPLIDVTKEGSWRFSNPFEIEIVTMHLIFFSFSVGNSINSQIPLDILLIIRLITHHLMVSRIHNYKFVNKSKQVLFDYLFMRFIYGSVSKTFSA